jgi:SAM-dependent methyltransferase
MVSLAGQRHMRVADYNSISSDGYDARYRKREYEGIQQALISVIGSVSSPDVLEVGAGTGHWLGFFLRHGCRATGLDLSRTMLARARETAPTVPLIQGRAEAMPFQDNAFDRVVCVNALHHFGNTAQFLTEVRRVLRASGAFMSIGLDPHTGRDSWWLYEFFPEALELDRDRYPSADALREDMVRTGFARCETREVQHIAAVVSAESARSRGYLDRGFTSQLTILSDDEYGRGLQRLEDGINAASATGTELLLTTDLQLYATMGWANVVSAAGRPSSACSRRVTGA